MKYKGDKYLAFKDTGDGFINLDGGYYRTRAGAVWFEVLNFCGCGDPNASARFIGRLLTENSVRFDDGKPRPASIEDAKKLVLEEPETAGLTLLYLLDAFNLTEHGGSVNGAWLTPLGEQVAKLFLEENVSPEDDN